MDALVKKAFLIGLGALTLTRERAEQFLKEMEAKGEITSSEFKELVGTMMEKGEEAQKTVTDFVKNELERVKQNMGLVTREDLNRLEERINALEARLGDTRPGGRE